MARSTTATASRNGAARRNGFESPYIQDGKQITIGVGRPIEHSTLVQNAQARAAQIAFDEVAIPNMVEMQLNSYSWFLNTGLRELFSSFSPIEDFTGTMSLEFLDYSIGEPKFEPEECRQRDLTYEMPLKVKVRVVNKETGELKESEVYLGELPCMTERGTFIINGAERVVVSQLSRSPGAYFKEEIAYSGRRLLQMQIIPHEGAWIDAEVAEEATKDVSASLGVKIGQSKRMPMTILLRAFSAMDVAQPHAARTQSLAPTAKNLLGRVLAEQLIDYGSGEIVAEEGTVIDKDLAARIKELRDNPEIEVTAPRLQCATTQQLLDLFGEARVLARGDEGWELVQFQDPSITGGEPEYNLFLADELLEPGSETAKTKKAALRAFSHIDAESLAKIQNVNPETLTVYHCPPIIAGALAMDKVREAANSRAVGAEEDATTMEQLALAEVHKNLRPGDPPTQESARSLLNSFFFDPKRYDMGRVGRYKLNKKIGGDVPNGVHTLTLDDLILAIRYVIELDKGEDDTLGTDDIDHLRNKRVRAVGELLQNQLRQGMLRMERVARERLTSLDRDTVTAQAVISIKPITAAVRSFFGSGQLSQFMDQTNPLAELAHKRRLSVLGPGGLSRQSAKLEVRDVHHSHYGRICPIETPEGPNIGLIGSLATHARIDDYGFLQTPYRVVKNGKVTEEIVYLPADEEEKMTIASASALVDEKGRLTEDAVQVRRGTTHPQVPPTEVDYIDLSPLQVFSVATAMIPFLENDAADRALMGSNMQRQAVPLVRPQVPLVKTGIERRAANDSGASVASDIDGVVQDVTAKGLTIRGYDGEISTFNLRTFVRSNQGTCIHYRPIVAKGEHVKVGQPIADGPATRNGELALGRNMTVAFSLWEGYNYEDAIILSDRVTKEDALTSVHIQKYEVEARDTKLGPEELTREIPNIGEDQLRNLDEEGIIRVGAEVLPQDILCGKIAPKSQGELSAEERLVIAIFGKKAEESRDASLRMPHGEKGTVVAVQIFSRHKYFSRQLFDKMTAEGMSEDAATRQSTFSLVNDPERPECPVTGGTMDKVPGDELRAGTNQMVRVYVAQKRKIMEGDKMAGRHGNKGVVSRIMPEADMPYLPDGTPVDIILNPLGVPSRMNIGQILEMHLGLVGKHFGTEFENPIFDGAREPEIYDGMRRVAEQFEISTMTNYIETEMDISMEGVSPTTVDEVASTLATKLGELDDARLDELGAQTGTDAGEYSRSDKNRKTDLLVQKVREITRRRSGFDPETGKCVLRDGRTGEPFQQPVAMGQMYMLKLHHLVEDKIHARSTGPYSLVTQQPHQPDQRTDPQGHAVVAGLADAVVVELVVVLPQPLARRGWFRAWAIWTKCSKNLLAMSS